MSEVECVLAVANVLGEGPRWNPDEQALYWVDIKNDCYHRFHPATGTHEVVPVGVAIGVLAMRARGGLVMATSKGFAFWDPQNRALSLLADPEADNPATRFNDGAVDPQGRFWAGTMNESDPMTAQGCLYRLDPDGSVHRMETGITVSNGIGWSLDHKIMYFTDSLRYVIYAYDYDPVTGRIANRRPFVQLPAEQGVPDGLAVDREGFVWSALWGGWKVVRFDPEGKLEREIPMPVANPTAPAFGGPQLDELYITSARLGLSEDDRKKQPLAGNLFRLKTEVRGSVEPKFLG